MTQHMDALAHANRVRVAQAKLKVELKSLGTQESRHLLADLLGEPSEELGRLRVLVALCACFGTGPNYGRRMLALAEVAREDKRVMDLTPRQRDRLARALRGELRDVWKDAA